jgi:hypothetical protein
MGDRSDPVMRLRGEKGRWENSGYLTSGHHIDFPLEINWRLLKSQMPGPTLGPGIHLTG